MELGLFIKETRKRLGLSQEDLCNQEIGIRTIQRIENGDVIPHQNTLEQIFKKFGIQIPLNFRQITESEYKAFRIQIKIEEICADRNFCDELKSLLENYKNLIKKNNLFEQEFYYLHQGQYEKYVLCDFVQAKKTLEFGLKNLKKSSANYDLKNLKFVPENEIMTLYEYACCEDDLNEKEAEFHFLTLQEYLERGYFDKEKKKFLYPSVLLRNAKFLKNKNKFKKIADLRQKGIKFCLENDSILCLEDIIKLDCKK